LSNGLADLVEAGLSPTRDRPVTDVIEEIRHQTVDVCKGRRTFTVRNHLYPLSEIELMTQR
jgi:hypothetical protein